MPAKKDGWGQWNGDLPEGPALDHLDELARELGMTRAEANRVVLVAWSRALRGIPLIPAVGGGTLPLMAATGPGAMIVQQQSNPQQDEEEQPTSPMDVVRARAAVTTSGLDLDDD